MTPEQKLRQFIGKRVLILFDHPWQGNMGIIREVSKPSALTNFGAIVTMDNEKECYVFHPELLKDITSEVSPEIAKA